MEKHEETNRNRNAEEQIQQTQGNKNPRSATSRKKIIIILMILGFVFLGWLKMKKNVKFPHFLESFSKIFKLIMGFN